MNPKTILIVTIISYICDLFRTYFYHDKRKLSQFNFDLPDELLAIDSAENRDESRLMVVHRDTGEIEHKMFKDLIDYFDDGDVMTLIIPKFFLRACTEIKKKQVHASKYSR